MANRAVTFQELYDEFHERIHFLPLLHARV